METRPRTARRVRVAGAVLIIVIGLLNFHIPHFLIQSLMPTSTGGYLLELLLMVNVLGAVVAAVGIYRARSWGWQLGLVIVGASVAFYVAQETVGLPGLPKMWLEPSRVVSLLVEVGFAVLAGSQLARPLPPSASRSLKSPPHGRMRS